MAILRDNYSGTAEPYSALTLNDSDDWAGQSFTTTVGYSITRIDTYCRKDNGDNVGTLTFAIYSVDGSGHPNTLLATGSVDDADVPDADAGYAWVSCTLASSYNLSSTTKYCVVFHGASLSGSNVLRCSRDDDGAGSSDFAGGDRENSVDGGSSWSTDTTDDLLFRCYGDNIPISDKIYSKNLIAISNHEVWYQTDDTTMTELTDAKSDVNTVNPLTAFEAFQKLFIANKTDLKVTDFANAKITTADIGSNPPVKGTILTGSSSGAVMVCDYINASSSATTLYGYRTSTATFTSSDTVTGTNPVTFQFGGTVPYGTAVSFDLNANEVGPPHWYTWTPYANDTDNFGSMPASAYISCRYRGRCVLSGHPNYPHQWYMSKVANPWNWTYGATDPLTAVAANNADAGEIGDIVSAMIPYGDDFLVFGCATSIHILTGDPAFSGQIDELDNTTGIFSPWSWCKDDKGNLYFWGANGLYVMMGGREKPINISEGHLPKLVSTWAVDPDTHRIVLSFDPLNQGLVISRTTLEDGTNLNYFYDLQTQGFYPETYPEECGIYSNAFYDSDKTNTKGLILGCKDGYLRKFTYSAKDDDIGATDEAISSYFTLAMVDMNEQDDNGEGKLTSLTVTVGGGASDGADADSDAVSYDIHVSDDAETCLEDIKDGATPIETGTFTGTGRFRIRTRLRGKWLGIKFYNSTISETFVINLIAGDIRPAGTI
jgi:hypothetical protein